ncbi:uncharacterized protein [Miscanthus floridulus]|uniref:uncharacterized protein n=1 Tax=Miscanthus floridulus TaxID=154761 RepID=UPI003459203A
MSALEAIIAAVPAEYKEPLGAKSSAKETLEFKDGESVEDFFLRLQTLFSKLRSHGVTIDEEEAVSEYLHYVPANYIQIALSIETMLDLSTLTIENADEDDEATLLMMTFCALHDVKAKEKGEVVAVEGHGKALKAVHLDEPRSQVHLERVGGEMEQRWYLDSGTSNHMTGSKETFFELDGNVIGTLKFGDSSRVTIRGRSTIIFRCQNDEHRALTDVYYIPQLRSSIISIGQLDKRGNEVLIKDSVLRIRDREQRLLTKVKRS